MTQIATPAEHDGLSMKNSLIDARFKGNVIFSYGAQVAGIGVGFVSITLMTRYAGIETYGMVAMMTALAGILSNLLTFRTSEAVVNFYKRGKIENNLGLCRMALMIGLGLDMVVGTLLFLLVQEFSSNIAILLLKHPEMETGVATFAGVMLATFLRGTPLGLLVAEERFRFINGLQVAEPTLKIILLVSLIGMGVTLSFEHIIWTMLLPSVVITLIVYQFPLREIFGPLRLVTIPRHCLGNYVRFSISTFLSSSLKAGNQNIDTLILGYLTNPSTVGIYNLFRQFLAPMAMLASPFSAQIYPRFVQAVAEKNPQVIGDTIRHASRLLLRGFVAMLAVILLVLYIYGQWNHLNFTLEHYATFAVMVASALLVQQLWWARSFSNALNPNISLMGNIISVGLVLLSVPVLTQFGGIIGCAIGMFINHVTVYFFFKNALLQYLI